MIDIFLIEHPLASLIITAACTLFAKYFWDRYLSQPSRVNRREFDDSLKALRNECELKRSGCIAERVTNKTYFESLIKQQAGCLEDAFEGGEVVEKRRGQTRRALLCIMMSQLKICEALNASGLLGEKVQLECGDITHMMMEMGAIE